MKIRLCFAFFLIFPFAISAQKNMDKTLKKFNSESIPYTQVAAVSKMENTILLDARMKKEYSVSHLKNSIWVGYEAFELNTVTSKIKDKDSEIVVYCSIGVRSEDIGEKLKKAGYTNIKNLYGGIFEWKNQGHPVYNNQGIKTDSVHAFDKQWGKLLTKGKKVYQ